MRVTGIVTAPVSWPGSRVFSQRESEPMSWTVSDRFSWLVTVRVSLEIAPGRTVRPHNRLCLKGLEPESSARGITLV
jgi:hypothetical protein